MLVLSRTVGEGVLVGESQLLTVTEIKPEKIATLQYGPTDGPASAQVTQTLRRDESWQVQPEVRFTVIDIRSGPPDKVRLGIECPREMPVHRREIYDAIQRESNHPTE